MDVKTSTMQITAFVTNDQKYCYITDLIQIRSGVYTSAEQSFVEHYYIHTRESRSSLVTRAAFISRFPIPPPDSPPPLHAAIPLATPPFHLFVPLLMPLELLQVPGDYYSAHRRLVLLFHEVYEYLHVVCVDLAGSAV